MTVREVRSFEAATLLEYKRRQTDLSQERLAELFRAAGGEASNGTVGAWLRGEREPGAHSAYLLAQIINEHLSEEEDSIPLVPFYLAPMGDGDGAELSNKESRAHNRYSDELGSDQERDVA